MRRISRRQVASFARRQVVFLWGIKPSVSLEAGSFFLRDPGIFFLDCKENGRNLTVEKI